MASTKKTTKKPQTVESSSDEEPVVQVKQKPVEKVVVKKEEPKKEPVKQVPVKKPVQDNKWIANTDDDSSSSDDETPAQTHQKQGATYPKSITNFNFTDYTSINKPISELDSKDILRVLIARAHNEGQRQLKKTLNDTLRAMNLECNFPVSINVNKLANTQPKHSNERSNFNGEQNFRGNTTNFRTGNPENFQHGNGGFMPGRGGQQRGQSAHGGGGPRMQYGRGGASAGSRFHQFNGVNNQDDD